MTDRSETNRKVSANGADRRRRDVMCVRFSALGDVAMALPPLYDAARSNPGRRFIFMTRKHPAELFINRPANLEVFTPDLKEYRGVWGMFRLYREIRRRYPETGTFVDLHDVLRTKLLRPLFRLGGSKVVRLDKMRKRRRALTKKNRKRLEQLPPVSESYRDTLRSAGIELSDGFTSVFGDRTPHSPEGYGPKNPGEIRIAVAPFARHKGKIYPANLMAATLDILAENPDTRIFVFGFGKEESDVIEGWCRNHANMINMASAALGIERELAILAGCDVMLSMDSANMHMAALVGLPTVTVWGATHPFTGFNGATADEADAVQLNLTCRPCSIYGNLPCRRGDYFCLGGIPPKNVADAVMRAIHNHRKKRGLSNEKRQQKI